MTEKRAPQPPLIQVEGLKKEYAVPGLGHRKRVLRGVDLEIKRGRVYGLMGLTGAGKSTLVGVLAGLVTPSRGKVLLKGKKATAARLRANVALALGTDRGFYDKLSVLDNLVFFAILQGVERTAARERSLEVLRLVALEAAAETPYQKLSSGQRRQLSLARALLVARPLLIADEPTRGLDPSTEQTIVDLLASIKAQGQTMLVVTHDVHLAHSLCDWVGILDEGQVVRQGTPDELVHLLASSRIHIRFHAEPDAALERLKAIEHLTDLHHHDLEVHVYCQDPENDINDVVHALVDSGVPIAHLALNEPGLEEVFLKVVAERRHQEERAAEAVEDAEAMAQGSQVPTPA